MVRLLLASTVACALVGNCWAVRIMAPTEFGDPSLQFDNIAITPDGANIVATGLFDIFFPGDRVYSFPIPVDPATQAVQPTQLSTSSFIVNNYDVAFAPVISPNGQSVLFVHDGNTPATNTIYKMPIAGEGMANFTGFIGADPNLASPGDGNAFPMFSPTGSTVFFLNNNAGFGGSIPTIPSSPTPYTTSGPDWDLIYSVPAAGGTPIPVTAPGDGDIDGGLFALTPDGTSIVFAPDNPVKIGRNRDGIRPKLFSIPATGGSRTEIAMPAPSHDFSVSNQLAITPDGQQVLFIGDYETLGKNELFSVSIGGGLPTRISDDLSFAGDVYSFAIAPNGTSVAYAAGQNTSSNTELFFTTITGGIGNSIRVSDPIAENSGLFDVSTSGEGGQIVFSPDSTKIYYLGDLDTEGVNDLYVVDTTEKMGLTPKPFFFVGPNGGEFFDEMNWEDADGNHPPVNSINPNEPIRQSLIIDGDTVVATTTSTSDDVQFQLGGSLELTPGSRLSSERAQLLFNPGSGLKLTDATISFREDVILSGTNVLSGGLIESFADDVEFQDNHKSIIHGTTLRSTTDTMIFENSATSITDATFESAGRLSLRYEIEVTVVDTTIRVNNGLSDVEDAFAGAQGEGSVLTLKGTSTLLANAIQDGVSLVLDGTSVATLLGANNGVDLVDSNGTITFMSAGAEMITQSASASDVRARIFNGLTGLSYLDDPAAWTVANWNGITPLASLQLLSMGIDGDYNDDGRVDAADYTVWRDNLNTMANLPNDPTPGQVTIEDYAVWKSNFGLSAGSGAAVVAVPEPSAICICIIAIVASSVSGIRLSRGARIRR